MAARPNFHLLPLCEEKQRLRAIYRLAMDQHAISVNEALGVRGRVSEEESDRFRALRDEARNARDAARLALEQHKKEHSC